MCLLIHHHGLVADCSHHIQQTVQQIIIIKQLVKFSSVVTNDYEQLAELL